MQNIHHIKTPVFDWAHNFIQKINVSNNRSILDIGCRSGMVSALLADKFKNSSIVAIEKCDQLVQAVRDCHKRPNIIFECENPESINITQQFDLVTSFSYLHWTSHPQKVIHNIYQALKPGGKAYFQFCAWHGRPKNDRFLHKTANTPRWKSYCNGFSPRYFEVSLYEFSAWLDAAGFLMHSLEFQHYESKFDHPEQFLHWLGSWATHKDTMPKRKQQCFLKDTVDSYLQAFGYLPENAFPYYEYVLEVVCEKPSITIEKHEVFRRNYPNILFTKREELVLSQYLQGKSSKEIASILLISSKTVEFHVANIKNKLHCHKRSDIYKAMREHGFI